MNTYVHMYIHISMGGALRESNSAYVTMYVRTYVRACFCIINHTSMEYAHTYVRTYIMHQTCMQGSQKVVIYGTFHNKLDDEWRSNGRSINGRTYTVHSPDVHRTDDRPIIITSLLKMNNVKPKLIVTFEMKNIIIKYILINTIYVYDLTSCIV